MAEPSNNSDHIDQSYEYCIELFRRQFLQLEEPDKLEWPPLEIVRRPDLQAKVYDSMFREGCLAFPPPESYKLRVLKILVKRLEQAAMNPEEDEISDDIAACLAELLSQPQPAQIPDISAAQRRTYVTYTSPTSLNVIDNDFSESPGPLTVTLLESRSLLASSGTTGLRTWEAALRLGTFLASGQGPDLIRGKNVLELGAGTGFVSILCAKHLCANHVLATDGSGDVVDALVDNIYLNGLDQSRKLETTVLKWGHGLIEDLLNGDENYREYDLLIGTDVVSETKPVSLILGFRR